MKKYLSGLLVAALLLAYPAVQSFAAGFNIAQPDTGTEWRATGVDNQPVTIPVGEIHLSVLHDNITTPSTSYAVVPVTNMRVTSIRGVLSFPGGINALTQNITSVRFWNLNTNGVVLAEITNATSVMTFATAATASQMSTMTPTTSGNNGLGQGHRIAIQSSGAANQGPANVTFFVTLQPR